MFGPEFPPFSSTPSRTQLRCIWNTPGGVDSNRVFGSRLRSRRNCWRSMDDWLVKKFFYYLVKITNCFLFSHFSMFLNFWHISICWCFLSFFLWNFNHRKNLPKIRKRSTTTTNTMAAHKTFIIKRKLAKAAKQNRPLPHWVWISRFSWRI